jgi:L-methionine (R)-S-oxide reductase
MNNFYQHLHKQIATLASSEKSKFEILQESSEILKVNVFHYDWVGFYILDDQDSNLILGPYSGHPTEHTIIPIGKGVCGQVAQNNTLKVVQDVRKEENYIACSLDVKSEIVVPIIKNGKFVAEIDIDSHSPSPFTSEDQEFLIAVCKSLSELF